MSSISDCIIKILVDNGVSVEQKEIWGFAGKLENVIQLDFSAHDKVFENKIAELEKRIQELDTIDAIRIDEKRELKQRIAELESKEAETVSDIDTSNPLACAESLIEHMTHCEKFMIMPERDVQTFSVEELKEIADYLMVYYKHHRDRDTEPIAF